MNWLAIGLGMVGIGSIVCGCVILASGVNTQNWRCWKLPIVLFLAGGVTLLFSMLHASADPKGQFSLQLWMATIFAAGFLFPLVHVLFSLVQRGRVGHPLLWVSQTPSQRVEMWYFLSYSAITVVLCILNKAIILQPLAFWMLIGYFLLRAMDGLALRENGISCAFLTLPWQHISSYQWVYRKEIHLILHFHPRFSFLTAYWRIAVPASRQAVVDRILAERLPGKVKSPEE